MTNLQEDSRNQLFGDRFAPRLLFWGPIGVGGFLAALVLSLGVVPSLLRSGSTQESLQTARDLASQLPSARLQLEQERRTNERIQAQRTTLLSLIGRPGTVATFLAELDRQAALQQVQLDLYEPQAAASLPVPGGPPNPDVPPEPGAPPNAPTAPTPTGSPSQPQAGPTGAAAALQVEGLQRTTLMVSARGTYPALLRFLRAIERLNVLVAQSDLSLTLEANPPPSAPIPPVLTGTPPQGSAPVAASASPPVPASAISRPPAVVMKLTISLYEPAGAGATGSQLPGRP